MIYLNLPTEVAILPNIVKSSQKVLQVLKSWQCNYCRLDESGCAQISGRFLKNCPDDAGFLRFCSDFCNFSACSECYWAVCQTAKQRFKRYALNLESEQSQKPSFLPGFLLESRPDFHKKRAWMNN